MNKLLTVLTLVLLTCASNSQAVTIGYTGLVVFTDGTTFHPAGETMEQCEESRERLINDYMRQLEEEAMMSGSPVTVSFDPRRSLPCGPRNEDISNIGFIGSLLPVTPYCLSCPLYGPETFDVLFPSQELTIESLYYQYNIDQYNQQLFELQQEYNLRGFEKAVYLLRQEQQ